MITRMRSIPVLINMFDSPFILGVFREKSGDVLRIVETFEPGRVPALGRQIHFIVDIGI